MGSTKGRLLQMNKPVCAKTGQHISDGDDVKSAI